MSKEEKKSGRGKRRFSDSEKKKILRAFKFHQGSKESFFQAQGITGSAVYRWKQEAQEKKAEKSPELGRSKSAETSGRPNQNRIAARKEAVEAFLKREI